MPAREGRSNLGLALLLLEGYAYLFLIVATFGAVIALLAWGILAWQPLVAIIALFVGLPATLLTGSAIRALAFRRGEVTGIELTPAEAPELFAVTWEISRAIGCPRIDRLVLDSEPNASAIQVPRIAIFWPVNILRIGYPLLAALSPEQFRAVVAHELAHLFHSHGMVAGWIHRTRLSWFRLGKALAERQTIPVFVRWLFGAYLPRLEAHSAAISRDQEFLADWYSALVADPRNAADALVASEVGSQLLREKFWPAIFAEVDGSGDTPRPYARMASPQTQLIDDRDAPAILKNLLEAATSPGDTHPSLRDRLQSLGERAVVPARPEKSAGEAYLGAFLQVIAGRLDREWEDEHGAGWWERQARIRTVRTRLAELEALGDASPQGLFGRGEFLEELGDVSGALGFYRRALAADARHAGASLAAGRICLERGEEEGIALLEHAMEVDASLVPAACERLLEHYEHRGLWIEAQRCRARATRHRTRAAIADAERSGLSALDRFGAHAMTAEELRPLVSALEREASVRAAFLATRKLRHSEGEPLALCLVAPGTNAADLQARLRSTGRLPADAQIFLLDRDQQPLRCALEALPGARIYLRR